MKRRGDTKEAGSHPRSSERIYLGRVRRFEMLWCLRVLPTYGVYQIGDVYARS